MDTKNFGQYNIITPSPLFVAGYKNSKQQLQYIWRSNHANTQKLLLTKLTLFHLFHPCKPDSIANSADPYEMRLSGSTLFAILVSIYD